MNIRVEKELDRAVFIIDGDIDYMNVGELKREINGNIESGIKKIILDLEDVQHIDSMAIGLFAVTQKKMKGLGGEFALVNTRSDVKALLKLSSVDRMLNIYDSIEEIK